MVALLPLLAGCPDNNPSPPDDDDTTTAGDDDTSDGDDDDSARVLTPLSFAYLCLSHGGDGSVRPWYVHDPWSYIDADAEDITYEDSDHVRRSIPTADFHCGAIWNWDVDADTFPTEPGWFVSGVLDLEVFHGIERLVLQAYRFEVGGTNRCDLEPDVVLQVRGGDDPDALSEWTALELSPTEELPDEICFKQWRVGGDQPAWAGRYLQIRIDLYSDPEAGQVQAALPLFIEYMTTVPYYYWAQQEVYSEP